MVHVAEERERQGGEGAPGTEAAGRRCAVPAIAGPPCSLTAPRSASPHSPELPLASPHSPALPLASSHGSVLPLISPHSPALPLASSHSSVLPLASPHSPALPLALPHSPAPQRSAPPLSAVPAPGASGSGGKGWCGAAGRRRM